MADHLFIANICFMAKKEPEIIKLNPEKVEKLEKEIISGHISSETQTILINIIKWAIWINRVLELKALSMKKFKRMIFGSKTEKDPKKKKDQDKNDDPPASGNSSNENSPTMKKPKKNGNGRVAGANYTSDKEIIHTHSSLRAGDSCPDCQRGTLYDYRPTIIITFEGNSPISTVKNIVRRLRCSACGTLFTPEIAEKLRSQKYDESVAVSLALMRYGFGMPFKRLESYQ